MKNRIFKLIKRDLIVGFEKNKYKFLVIALVFTIIIYANAYGLRSQAIELGISNNDINFVDLFFSIFKGINYNKFPLPINWILINMYTTYLIGSYCYDDLSEESYNVIVRSKDRKNFWISKVVWMVITIITFYILLLFLITFFSITIFNVSFEWSTFSKETLLEVIQTNWVGFYFILFTLFIYFLTSITIAIIQLIISFIIKLRYIYIINIFIFILSIFSNEFIIPIQGSLILRQNIFNKLYHINPLNSVMYNLIVFVISFIIGFKYIEKIDILRSQNND
ncbi:MAG: hypothetical protein E6538_02795 [Paeniclostridium sordellii]|nr:hypothetical protein [Paeniclostridium sordellii]